MIAAGASLLNLANPVQNSYFLGEFFSKFSKHSLRHSSPKNIFTFWQHFAPRKKKRCLHPRLLFYMQEPNCYCTSIGNTHVQQKGLARIAILHARTQVLFHKYREHWCATKGFARLGNKSQEHCVSTG